MGNLTKFDSFIYRIFGIFFILSEKLLFKSTILKMLKLACLMSKLHFIFILLFFFFRFIALELKQWNVMYWSELEIESDHFDTSKTLN